MLSRLKPKAEPPETAEPSYEESRAAIAAAKAVWDSIGAELEALNVAGIKSGATDAEWNSDRCEWARRKFAEYWSEKSPPAAWRIPNLAREINERRELAHPAWVEAQQRWQHACQRQTSRIAKSLQPRQRAAVKKIAAAVEALSISMAEERQLHQELERTAPHPTSAYLPPCSPRISGVEQFGSEFHSWRKRIRGLGILD